MQLDPIEIEIIAKDAASVALQQIKTEMQNLGKSGEDAAPQAIGFADALKAVAASAVAAKVIQEINQFMRESVESFSAAEKATARLEVALRNSFDATKAQTAAFEDLASQLQKTTEFSDEQIMSATAVLGTFQLTEDQIKQTIPRMLDMAAATERVTGSSADLENVAQSLGKALNGNVALLGRTAGINVEQLQKQLDGVSSSAERTDIILSALDQHFRGMAEGSANTLTGQLQIANHQWDEMKENVGQSLLPVLIDFMKVLNDNKDEIQSLATSVADLAEGFIHLTAPLAQAHKDLYETGLIAHAATEPFGDAGKYIENLAEVVPGANQVLATLGGQVLGKLVDNLHNSTMTFDEWTKSMNLGKDTVAALKNSYGDLIKQHDDYVTSLNIVLSAVEDGNLTFQETNELMSRNILTIKDGQAVWLDFQNAVAGKPVQFNFDLSGFEKAKDEIDQLNAKMRDLSDEQEKTQDSGKQISLLQTVLQQELNSRNTIVSDDSGKLTDTTGAQQQQITEEFAQRAGFPTKEAFVQYLEQLNVIAKDQKGNFVQDPQSFNINSALTQLDHAGDDNKLEDNRLTLLGDITKKKEAELIVQQKLSTETTISSQNAQKEHEYTTKLFTSIQTDGPSAVATMKDKAGADERSATALERQAKALQDILDRTKELQSLTR